MQTRTFFPLLGVGKLWFFFSSLFFGGPGQVCCRRIDWLGVARAVNRRLDQARRKRFFSVECSSHCSSRSRLAFAIWHASPPGRPRLISSLVPFITLQQGRRQDGGGAY
jgi:hypothetical protein